MPNIIKLYKTLSRQIQRLLIRAFWLREGGGIGRERGEIKRGVRVEVGIKMGTRGDEFRFPFQRLGSE
jgi:Ribonuclease G/E